MLSETTTLILTNAASATAILLFVWKSLSWIKASILKEVRQEIKELKTEMQTGFSSLRMEARNDLHTGLAAVNFKLDTISNQLAQLGSFYDDLEADTIAIDRRLVVVETLLDEKKNPYPAFTAGTPTISPRRSRRSRSRGE